MGKKATSTRNIFSRDFYEKITFFLTAPLYIIFLIGIRFGWLPLTQELFPKIIVLTSIPLLLVSLYFTSRKKVVPQRMGDCLQSLVWILVIAAGNTYWGGPLRIDGPLFLGNVLLIPFFALLLDIFLPYFVSGITAGLLIIEFLLKTPEVFILSIVELFFKIVILVIIATISSALIQRIFIERKISQELREAYEELKKLDKAKSEFISIASHQLRTPLTAIKGYLSMILEGTYGGLAEKTKRPMENVYQSNERLIKLVNDILNVTRIEAGGMEMKFEKSSLEEVINSAVEELKVAADQKGIFLKFEKPTLRPAQGERLPKILIDKDKIRQVILNVVDNAIRYTNKGGVTVKIQNQKSKIKIIVTDTGEGMTKEELSKLFESFSRGVAGTRLYTEGVGLGLYIARRLLELHDGKIWAESPGPDKGSTFYIELPIK